MRGLHLLLVVLPLLGGLAHAEHSHSPCASDVTPIGSGETMLYLVEDHEDDETWLFQESNGHPGLQRQGVPWYEIISNHYVDSECWDIDLATGEQIPDPDFIVL